MKSFVIEAVGLCLLLCAGCSSHDASDPSYGAMFKQTTRDRVSGNEFWVSRTEKGFHGRRSLGGMHSSRSERSP